MKLETAIALEDTVRKEATKRFPSLDPDWAAERYMDKMYDNSKRTAEVLLAWAMVTSTKERK